MNTNQMISTDLWDRRVQSFDLCSTKAQKHSTHSPHYPLSGPYYPYITTPPRPAPPLPSHTRTSYNHKIIHTYKRELKH